MNLRGIIAKIIIALIGSVIITCSIYSWQEIKVIAMSKTIHLPAPVTKGKVSLEEAIKERRSRRSFKDITFSRET